MTYPFPVDKIQAQGKENPTGNTTMYAVENVNGQWVVKVSNGIIGKFNSESEAKTYISYMIRMDTLDNGR